MNETFYMKSTYLQFKLHVNFLSNADTIEGSRLKLTLPANPDNFVKPEEWRLEIRENGWVLLLLLLYDIWSFTGLDGLQYIELYILWRYQHYHWKIRHQRLDVNCCEVYWSDLSWRLTWENVWLNFCFY